MAQAKDRVVVSSGKEVHTEDFAVHQRSDVNISLPRESESIILATEYENPDHIAELAFMEEPITIRLQKSSDRHAANVVQCWVNGRGAEVLTNGKWMVNGWLPVNVNVTTKRKYVEVLARAKRDTIETEAVRHDGREDNFAHRYTSTKYPFSVIEDKNPRGMQWLSKVLSEY